MIESPCIKQCKLDENQICIACFRKSEEIQAWSNAPDHERKAILRKAFHRKFTRINPLRK